MKRKQYNNIRFRTSSGFALPLVLLTFVLIALISSVSVRMSLMDENLGRNQTDRNISKKMAELALMDARDDLLCSKTISGYDKSDGREFYNNGTLYVDNGECVEGLCGKPNGDDDPKYWETLHSGDTEIGFARYGQFSGRDSLGTGLFGSAREPRYIIEAIQTKLPTGTEGNNEWQYRFTVVGYGRYNQNVFTKLQEIYRFEEGTSKCSYGTNASYTRNISPGNGQY